MKIIQVGCGEYHTAYLHEDGTVAATCWDAAKGKHTYQLYKDPETKTTLTGIISVVGGQYTSLCLKDNGIAYELTTDAQGAALAIKIALPADAGAIRYIMMHNRAKYLVNDKGDLYYLATDSGIDKDALLLGTNYISSTPKLLLSGYNIKRIDVGEAYLGIIFLTNDGKVYKLYQTKTIPVLVLDSVTDIAMVGRGAFVAVRNDDILAWGPLMSYVTGNPDEPATTTPKSIKALWPVKFPVKQIVGNWNTLHILDSYDVLWAAGENVMGEVGNGKGCPDWKNYKAADGKTLQPYAWNWNKSQMLQPPVKLPGRWKYVSTSGSMAVYLYEIDILNTLHSHGRDKKRALGSGLSQPDNAYADKYPNWKDVWSPTPVDPSTVEWKYINFDPATAENNFPVNTSFPSDSVAEPDQPESAAKEVYSIAAGGCLWSFMDDGEIKFTKQ